MRALLVAFSLFAFGSLAHSAQPAAQLVFNQSGLQATVFWEVAPNLADESVLRIEFKNLQTQKLQDPPADIDAVLFMPDMGHGSAPGDVQKLGPGVYRVTSLYFFMGGLWEVRVTVNGANGSTNETQAFRLNLEDGSDHDHHH